MRDALANLLVETATKDDKFVVLSGDHGYALFDPLRAASPSQFINVGIAEQNMIGLAAGLARVGYRPCVYGLAAFVPIRVLEQIKLDICHAGLPLVILGDGAGLVYSTLGVSHQCGEDIACLRPLPGISIYSPCDRFELAASWKEALDSNTVSYIRLGKADRDPVHVAQLDNTNPVWTVTPTNSQKQPLIVATGAMACPATTFARNHRIPCLTVSRILPLHDVVMSAVRESLCAVVVEEHSSAGGLFSTIAESLVSGVDCDHFIPLQQIGLLSQFTKTAGTYENALSEHSINTPVLFRRLAEWLEGTKRPVHKHASVPSVHQDVRESCLE